MANNSKRQSPSSPIALLRKMQQLALENPLFHVETEVSREAYVGFTLCDTDFLAPLSCVPEIIRMPDNFIPVPGVKKWMVGLANVRGKLLPLVDFQQFMCQQPMQFSSSARVLIIEHGELYTGLIVPVAHGLIYVERTDGASANAQIVQAEGREWQLLDMVWLETNRDFRQAAA